MRIDYALFLLVFVFIAMNQLPVTCSGQEPPRPAAVPVNAAHLHQHWRRSHEEEEKGAGIELYRPHDAKQFPPSRFRMAYIFHANGSCEWYYLSPDDDHRFKPGKWKLTEGGKVLTIDEGEQRARYSVVELGPDILRIKRLPDDASKSK